MNLREQAWNQVQRRVMAQVEWYVPLQVRKLLLWQVMQRVWWSYGHVVDQVKEDVQP